MLVTLRVDEESLGKELEHREIHRAQTWHHPGDGSSFDREKKTSRSMSPPLYSRRRRLEDDVARSNASFSVWRLSDERDLNESHDEYEDEFREEKRHARKKQTFTPSYPAEKT